MSIGALDAASAYGRVLGTLKPNNAGATTPASESAKEANFGSMIEQMVTNASKTMQTAETASARQVAGNGDLIDVVTAIGAAENALETMVAVRDKVVGAYAEIMRMQI